MSKIFSGNFFEDFYLGQKISHGIPRTITSGDASLYTALTGSRFVLNCAEPVAKACGFEQMPLDNLLVFHIAFGKTVPDISLNAVANLGYAECQFLRPLFAGDTLFVSSEVIGLKPNSNGKTGIVYVHSQANNQQGDLIVSWKRWVMVHRRAPETHIAAIPPELNSFIAPGNQLIPTGIDLSKFDPSYSGQKHCWQDYQVGEEIDHIDGLTINDSDHTMATHLYQNNAKVHFNAHQMQTTANQKRLVYGGHIISLCRSLTHNGLGNGLWLAAIHGGTHANPSFAGDTIYAKSQIVDKGAFDSRPDVGWLRLKTWGIKNCQPRELESVKDAATGKFNPQVVLELDYSVLMAKRPA